MLPGTTLNNILYNIPDTCQVFFVSSLDIIRNNYYHGIERNDISPVNTVR